MQSIKTFKHWKIRNIQLWSFVFSIIALTVSIISICSAFPRIENTKFDYLGIIITIFALLITILIGWQIWHAFYFAEEIKSQSRENAAIKKTIDEKVQKLYDDINDNLEKRNKRHLEILEVVKTDYESTMTVLSTFILTQDEPSYGRLRYAIKIFRQFDNPKNLKAKTALEVLEATVNDCLVETHEYANLIRNIPFDDICWLYSYDYNKHNCKAVFKNFYDYRRRLLQLMRLYTDVNKIP